MAQQWDHIFLCPPPTTTTPPSKNIPASEPPKPLTLPPPPVHVTRRGRESSLRIDSLWYPKPMEPPGCQDTQHRRHSWGPGTRQLLPNNKGKKMGGTRWRWRWWWVEGEGGGKMRLKPPSQAPNWSPWASCCRPAHLPSDTAEDQLQLWDEVGGKLNWGRRQSEWPETKGRRREISPPPPRKKGAAAAAAAVVAAAAPAAPALPRLYQVTHGGP